MNINKLPWFNIELPKITFLPIQFVKERFQLGKKLIITPEIQAKDRFTVGIWLMLDRFNRRM